ncbi:GAF domain-containing protein [Paenibacillus sp. UMB4589-SE434]|uniref:GAF domain-containing protein n=1 Tax=Paenibacillus sp. UMB4589-SE434 TaxID=3046314 RepID=UPI00254B6C98|nr:GAF domain-containing protein [Paenibacillus sp. UMB4589-SE434]MDK8183435.1 GAF domain-containing protein [Paenibacillus sp. UMB4589-SE434]
MFEPTLYSGIPEQDYPLLRAQLAALVEDEPNLIANLANAAALLWHGLQDINWAGFYLYEEATNQLVLGPFQGMPACVRIPLGRGVCGTSAQDQQTLVVADVHEFPGHIACDARSRSEIVVPLVQGGRLIGVLDIDSPSKERFHEVDQKWLEQIAQLLMGEV